MADLFEHTYRIAIVSLPIVAVTGVFAPILVGMGNFAILGLYLAVPMILAAAVVWRLGEFRGYDRFGATTVDWRALSAAFHVVVALSVFLLTAYEVRPLSFYAGLALLSALVLALIWTSESSVGHSAICLYHVAVIVVLTVFSVTLKYDFFVGDTDLTAHVSMIDSIVRTGAPIAIAVYEPFQLWHVTVAATHGLFGGQLATHTTAYLLSGTTFGVGVFAAYGLARRLHPDERFALLAALFTAFHPYYIYYGMYSIPRSITSFLFLVLLLALVGRSTVELQLVRLAVVVAIVLYHPVSIPFVFVVLAIVYVVERVIRSRPSAADRPVIVGNVTIGTIGVVTLTYWLYAAEYLVETVIWAAYTSISGSSSGSTPKGIVTSPWAEVANYVPYSFFVFFLLLGALLWLRDERGNRTAFGVFGVTTLLLVPLSVPGPTLLLDSLSGVNVGRFGHYTFMFLSLTAAAGAWQLLRRGGARLFLAILLITSMFAFTAVSNDFVARDNPLVERPFYTYYLTEQERQAYEDVDAMHTGMIETDRPTCRYMSSMLDVECTVVNASAEDELFDESESILIRDGELEKRPLQFSTYVDEEDIPRDELAERNRVYDAGSVSVYQ